MKFRYKIHKKILRLREPFGIARGTWTRRVSYILTLRWGRWTGLGEAQPSATYGEREAEVPRRMRDALKNLTGCDPLELENASLLIERSSAGYPCAKAAVEMALHDLAAKKLGMPLYRLLGSSNRSLGRTSYTIGLDSIEKMADKASRALRVGYTILKIKLDGKRDQEIIRAIASVHPGPLRLDANEAWTPRHARHLGPFLNQRGSQVSLIEQPFPRGRLDWTKAFHQKTRIPLFLDEDVCKTEDVWKVKEVCDGINVKLMKSGGLRETMRMIAAARKVGLQIMMGCMTESSLAITAAAHLGSLCDLLDLDGNLLLANDPYVGVACKRAFLKLSSGAGLGVRLRKKPIHN